MSGGSGPWWSWWSVEPIPLALLLAAALLHVRGQQERVRRGGRGGGDPRVLVAGAVALVVALVGPIPAWSEVLFWPHMVQHLLLTVVAAPLLAAGRAPTTIRIGLPVPARRAVTRSTRAARRVRRVAGDPPGLVLATATHALVVWLWHAPPAYDAAVRSQPLHVLEHALFLATAVWFWSEVAAVARRGRPGAGVVTLCLGAMAMQGAVLGALLTFAGRSLYAVYDGAGGLTALEDQQLAGALMWVPPGIVYAATGVRHLVRWLRSTEAPLPTPAVGRPGRGPGPSDAGPPGRAVAVAGDAGSRPVQDAVRDHDDSRMETP